MGAGGPRVQGVISILFTFPFMMVVGCSEVLSNFTGIHINADASGVESRGAKTLLADILLKVQDRGVDKLVMLRHRDIRHLVVRLGMLALVQRPTPAGVDNEFASYKVGLYS